MNAAPGSTPAAVGVPCPRCSMVLDPSQFDYDQDGELVCPICLARDAHEDSQAAVADSAPQGVGALYGASAAGVLLGGAIFCFSALGIWFFVASPLPIVLGAGTLASVLRDSTARTRLGTAGYFLVAAMSALATLLGLGAVAFGLLYLVLDVAS